MHRSDRGREGEFEVRANHSTSVLLRDGLAKEDQTEVADLKTVINDRSNLGWVDTLCVAKARTDFEPLPAGHLAY